MQGSHAFGWGGVVTIVRWLARIFAVFAGVTIAAFAVAGAVNYGISDWLPWVLYGLLGVGLLALIFWKGVGELISGLVLLSVAIWLFVAGQFDFGGLIIFGPMALGGVLFITCGWYALAQRSHRATHATA